MTSDTRETLPVKGSFYQKIKTLFEQQLRAAIMYENNGVTRAEGLVTKLYEEEGFTWMTIDQDITIRLDQLYAVNGIFSSDYSEC
ncbi:MAG TPA: hypothetical protein VMR70_18165 [Flavisolibacter sp.]|nr:hypothetical protein [Flavisolibacter sp.]